MLKTRIRQLEKESTQMTKSYLRPLNRSTLKSGPKMQISTLGN